MKKLLTATVALSLLASAGAASAQSYGGRYDGRSSDRYEGRRDYDRSDRYEGRRDYDRSDRYENRRRHDRYSQRWARQDRRNWRRGDYVPSSYRNGGYVVDYRAYRLRQPPRGYHYVRNGNDVFLTAIATGLIASVLVGALNNY